MKCGNGPTSMKRQTKAIHRRVRKPMPPPAKVITVKKKYNRKREKIVELEALAGC